jgi:RNA polymerase-binding transcription factor DksA
MVQANFPDKWATILKARRSVLLRSCEVNAVQLGYDDEDEPGYNENVASLLNSEFDELRALDHALEIYVQGQYGRCENCGRAIAAARLRAIPYATLCINCQRVSERVS